MRHRFSLFLIIILLLCSACASAETVSFVYAPDSVSPSKAERITLQIQQSGELTLEVIDSNGSVVATIRKGLNLESGAFTTTFSGYSLQGTALPAGNYQFRATVNGESVTYPFSIGTVAPQLLAAYFDQTELLLGSTLRLHINSSTSGTLSLLLKNPDGVAKALSSLQPKAGMNTFDLSLPEVPGTYSLSLSLTDENGQSSNLYALDFTVIAPTPVPTATPSPTPRPQPTVRPSALAEETVPGDFWSMEVGNYDWAAIWQVMISPMTVISGSGKEAEKQTYKLRAEPDKSTANSNVLGLITCETQGVHVLETLDNGWTLVEAYNSSYGDAYRRAGKGAGYGVTDDLIRGYVETARLKEFVPSTEYGLLIDKMTQELYLVTENGLLSTLLVSTGKINSSQPWNETPAGEYYLSSKVGNFPSGNLTCCYGMRFNNGDILHEVPYIYNEKYDIKDYSSTEKQLGNKASHGCVRVQRKKNDEGINMKWIWDNVPLKTKLLIWDDTGRPDPFMEYPVPLDTVLYYNPTGGKYYHANQNCPSINTRYLPLKGSLTYAELDDPQYTYLTPCSRCKPPELRPSEVDAINAQNGY